MTTIVSLSTEVVSTDTPLKPIDSVVVQVTTADGVTGGSYVWTWEPAEAGFPGGADLIRTAVRYLAPMVAGRDVFAYEAFFADVHERTLTLQLAGGPLAVGHAAIDMAIWDALCKTAGQPLHRLLGGYRDRAPIYRTIFGGAETTLDEVVAMACDAAEAGFASVKVPVRIDPNDPTPGLERLCEVRRAVPAGVGLRIDGGSWWLFGSASVDRIVRVCHLLDEFELDWIEDPFPPDQIERFARLRRELATPIATGENVFSHRAFRTMFEKEAVDVAILDPMRVGGITGFLKVARMAEVFGVSVATHAYGELGAELIPALTNGLITEHLPEIAAHLMEAEVQPVLGSMRASERPGIGLQFDPAALVQFRKASPVEELSVPVGS